MTAGLQCGIRRLMQQSPIKKYLTTVRPYQEQQDCNFEIDACWAERAWGIFEGRSKSDKENVGELGSVDIQDSHRA